MAAELDPTSKADMQLLFDVWFNTIWHTDTWPRFAAFTQRLIDGSVPWLMPARHQDQQQLQEVWRWWLDEKHPNRPTPAALNKKRSVFNKRNPVQGLYKQSNQLYTYVDKYPNGFRLAVKVMHRTEFESIVHELTDMSTVRVNYESTASKPPHVQQGTKALCAILEGVTQLIETGSLSWDGNRREAQGSVCSPNINITFVEPGTGAWNVHPDQQPFTCWGTYTAEELTTVMQRGLQPASAFADVFITRMASFVQRFQSNTAYGANDSEGSAAQKPVALRAQLMCGEALGLCLNQMPSLSSLKTSAADDYQQCAAETPSTASSSSSTSMTAPSHTFDIIDTGSLCDDVGLLPLLVAVTPRLSNHPAARLHTVPATWTTAAPRMDYYLQEQALGMPLTMTPTLLGLRLVTDIHYGRPTSYRYLVLEVAAFDPRELAWAPVPPSQPCPRLQLPPLNSNGTDTCAYQDVQWGPAGSIGAVLQNVCKICCTNNHHAQLRKHADVAVHLSTPQTFAWLLASCIPRLDMSSLMAEQQQPANTSSAVQAHGVLWALRSRVSALLPAHFRLAFQGAMDAVRASLQAATGSAAAEAAGVPACTHQSFLMLPISDLEHGELAVAAGVRLRRPYVRALLGAHADTGWYTFHRDRITKHHLELLGPGQFVPCMKLAGQHPDFVYEFAYEGSPLDPPPKNRGLFHKVMPIAKPMDDKELKIHVLDCCSVPYSKASGWRTAFMIPSDHASMQLPDETSMLISVGPDYYGTHQPQKHKFMDIPCQAVSSVLAQCFLHPLLHPPATQAATDTSSGRSFLQVVQLDETVWGYEVVLKLQGPGTASGLNIALPQAATAKPPPSHTGNDMSAPLLCTSSHTVEVSLTQPAGVSAQLVLGWPVAAGLGEPQGVLENAYSSGCGVTAKLKKSEGLVELKLAKAQVWERWPEDGTPPLIQLKLLPLQYHQHALHFAQQCMYNVAGSFGKSDRNWETIVNRNAYHPLRSFILRTSNILATQDPYLKFGLYLEPTKGENEKATLNMLVLVSNGHHVDTEDGQRFVIPAFVLDLELVLAMASPRCSGFYGPKFLQGLDNVLRTVTSRDKREPKDTTMLAGPKQHLAVIRRYLWHNAQRWQPNQWQQELLSLVDIPAGPAGPYILPCYATCITPLYMEHVQQFHHCDRVFDELFPAGIPPLGEPLPYPLPAPAVTSKAAELRSEAGSSGGGASASAQAEQLQGKGTPKPLSTGEARAGGSSSGVGAASSVSAGMSRGKQSAQQRRAAEKDHEGWVCEKMSELRVDFSHCTDEELRSMAEMAYTYAHPDTT